jgi:hypothetical protein
MAQDDSGSVARAERALARLETEFGGHPDVSLIDVGYRREHGRLTQFPVLRVHVRDRWLAAEPEDRVAFPTEVEGIPVEVTRGEYELE